jgi:hypothetical protein
VSTLTNRGQFGFGFPVAKNVRQLQAVQRASHNSIARASRNTRTLPEPFSLCDSERIRVPRFNRMDDLTSRCAAIGTELQ